MGIKTAANKAGQHTFSEDVLKIEKWGPDEDYLTIIDVPGIFRNTTEGVTTENDKRLVKEMVKRYIKDKRTIILAILPSNVDVATQEILTLAEEVDRTGDRTLGILTKADLLKEQSAKLAVVNLVEGRRKPLKLGYHLVTNRGGDDHGEEEDASAALREREAMFQEDPWNKLVENRFGVSSLQERLADLLGEITDRAFPELRSEMRKRLAEVEKNLKGLGTPRQTEREQQQYLVGIASSFQSIVRAALDADYSADPAFDQDELRLITDVVNITDKFNSNFGSYARTYLFETEKPAVQSGSVEVECPKSEVLDPNEEGDHAISLKPDGIIPFDHEEFPDLDRILVQDWEMPVPKKGIMDWIGTVHRRSRGLDLGSIGQGVLPSVFREQSAKWELLTQQYVSQIIILVHRFILAALKIVFTDSQVLQNITSAILSDLCARYEDGMKQTTFLVNVERQMKPYTLNHYFNHNKQRSYGARFKQTLEAEARYDQGFQGPSNLIINISKVEEAITNKSNSEYSKETIHDTLEAYYKVAYTRFVDNVFSQAVDYKLLSGPESPLRLFSEQWVLQLEKEQLLSMAGESRGTRERRERLKKEIQDLEAAMEILR